MIKKIIPILVMMLMITTTALPVLADSAQYGKSGQKEYSMLGTRDVTLDVAITTDWVNGWQDHGLRIREFDIDQDVYAYFEVSSPDNLYGLKMTHEWYYDNGTGLELKWTWWTTCSGNWTSWATWTWWDTGMVFGKGVGYIKLYLNDTYAGETNWYATDNTQPNTPTIDGKVNGKAGVEYEYTFNAIDPDGFNLSYYVDWGDGTNSDWTEFVDSGTDLKLKHTWSAQDDYTIQCRVKDLAHNTSDWATLDISMPKNKAFNFNFNLLEWLFERFPNAFPIIRQMLGL